MLLIKSWRKGIGVNAQEVLYYGLDMGGARRHLVNTAKTGFLSQPLWTAAAGNNGSGKDGA